MNVKLKVLTAGTLFFLGGQTIMAQKRVTRQKVTKQLKKL